MKKSMLIVTLIVLLSACSSLGLEPTPTLIPTPIPTQTLTPIPPFSGLDLESILIQYNDLPANLKPYPVYTNITPKYLAELPEGDFVLTQSFGNKNRDYAGSVTVIMYEDMELVTQAYELRVSGFNSGNSSEIPGIGEAATLNYLNSFYELESQELVFHRCHAFVYININIRATDASTSLSRDPDVISTYAELLDKRLESVVCQ